MLAKLKLYMVGLIRDLLIFIWTKNALPNRHLSA